MRTFGIIIILFSFTLANLLQSYQLTFRNYDGNGFTNKAEAQNEFVNGKKEGKWIEYVDSVGHITGETNSHYYALIIYN
jgi:hypothetical protein